jgi:hypothetical protein
MYGLKQSEDESVRVKQGVREEDGAHTTDLGLGRIHDIQQVRRKR